MMQAVRTFLRSLAPRPAAPPPDSPRDDMLDARERLRAESRRANEIADHLNTVLAGVVGSTQFNGTQRHDDP
jgi:hypothetical protein